MQIRIDKNSYGTVLSVYAFCAVCILACWLLIRISWLNWVLSAIFLAFSVFITYFFRVPRRQEAGNGTLVSSVADGKVVILEKVYEKEYLKRDCIQVSVYMDFFDVHVNFWPVTGEVTYYKYHPGRYLLAFLPKSSELNEHSSTCIKTKDGKEVFFKQIAGTFARRIVNYAEPGMQVTAGKQCGVIKFGSRIDMFLPLDADVQVEIGDYVDACETIIASLN